MQEPLNGRSMLLPSRDDGGKAAHWRAGAGILFLLLAFTPHLIASTDSATNASATAVPASPSDGAGAPAEETLLLEVQINGHPTGLIGEFTLSHGLLSARPEELRNLGFKVPQSHPWEPGALIPLSYLPGLEYTLDLKNQVLRVTVVDSLLMPTLLLPVAREGAEDHRVIESGTGATLNYDIVNRFASGQTGANGSLDFRVFAPWGVTSWIGSRVLAPAPAQRAQTGRYALIRRTPSPMPTRCGATALATTSPAAFRGPVRFGWKVLRSARISVCAPISSLFPCRLPLARPQFPPL